MSKTVPTRDRLVAAAFDLYLTQGFDQTTIDQITAQAGVSRATYFRHFPTKEGVVFPDHDSLLTRVDARLGAADGGSRAQIGTALLEASGIVLRHYLSEGDLARERYRLTRSVSGLRHAEIAGQFRYQQVFRRHLMRWLPGTEDALIAEVLANAVVTAHNHVLRDWLRDATSTPVADLAAGIATVTERLLPTTSPALAAGSGTSRVLVFDSALTPAQVADLLRTADSLRGAEQARERASGATPSEE